MVTIGSTGVGKSSLSNGIFEGPNFINNPVFEVSSHMDSCTNETKDMVRYVFNVNSLDPNFPKFRVVDTPGLDEGQEQDAQHLSELITKLKEIKNVSLFLITLNGSNMRFDENTKKLIQIFEDNFGSQFWKNTAIMFTFWSSSPSAKETRELQNLTKAQRTGEIIRKLRENFP